MERIKLFRHGLFCIMWYRHLCSCPLCRGNRFPISKLEWGNKIKYGIYILPRDIWVHIWLPKWCQGRGYYISIGLWLFAICRGY